MFSLRTIAYNQRSKVGFLKLLKLFFNQQKHNQIIIISGLQQHGMGKRVAPEI